MQTTDLATVHRNIERPKDRAARLARALAIEARETDRAADDVATLLCRLDIADPLYLPRRSR
jgi:hypothetical protein